MPTMPTTHTPMVPMDTLIILESVMPKLTPNSTPLDIHTPPTAMVFTMVFTTTMPTMPTTHTPMVPMDTLIILESVMPKLTPNMSTGLVMLGIHTPPTPMVFTTVTSTITILTTHTTIFMENKLSKNLYY